MGAPAVGFEPTTLRLTVECSAVELCGIDLDDCSRILAGSASQNPLPTGHYDEGYADGAAAGAASSSFSARPSREEAEGLAEACAGTFPPACSSPAVESRTMSSGMITRSSGAACPSAAELLALTAASAPLVADPAAPSAMIPSRRRAATRPYSVAERPIAVIGGRWVRASGESS